MDNAIRSIRDTGGKSADELRAIATEQAKLRVSAGIPIVAVQMVLLGVFGGLQEWSALLALAYCGYTLLCLLLANPGKRIRLPIQVPPISLLLATAVLDPMWVSIWLAATNEYGALLVGFYLFTILGFGFRAGRPLMHVCQVSAIVGFIAVMPTSPFWHDHLVVWASFLISLLIVPLYTGGLIKKLHEARARAERESRAKSDLLARVSHELRTPLSGIITSAELLAAESQEPRVQKRTETILALGKDLLHEISDLLDEAKYEANALRMDLAPMNLHEQMNVIRTTLEATAARKGLEFQVHVDTEVQDLVESDAYYLNRALINLAGNAVKFTDKGRVRVDVDLINKSDDAYRIRFIVQDTGIGIASEFHDRIFQPFSQVSQAAGNASQRRGGTGLGLTIAKQIVELLGGNMRLDSAPGEGSRFWFELNMQRMAPQALARAQPKAGCIAGMRVFAADDNETNLHLIKELLEMDGHQVTTAASGDAALAILSHQDFDILFLDYNLGDMDGIWLMQAYRFSSLKPAPTYFLTADSTALTASRLKESGAAGVLYKPVAAADLRKTINAIAGQEIAAEAGLAAQPIPDISQPDPAATARPMLTAVSTSPLDLSVIDGLRAVSRRPEFLAEMLERAEHDIENNRENIFSALAERQHAQVREHAHALKGVCASVGAVRLIVLATNLMRASDDELYASRERLRSDLQEAVNSTVKALRVAARQKPRASSSGGGAALHLT